MFPQNRENLANLPFCTISFLKSSECLFKYSKKLFKNLKIKKNRKVTYIIISLKVPSVKK